jgi:REP element-mobilizing transposase RayT
MEETMPRQARLDACGTLHHVMVRGIEMGRIVDDQKDRERFVNRMGKLAMDTGTQIYAWSLMSNHAHILLRSGPAGLPKYMRRLLTGHAVTYNRRHRRHGHLFQNRYKSIVCDEDSYFQELVRYIHLNPLRAKQVKDIDFLDRYPWSGHSALMGKIRRPWQDCDHVLSWFGKYRSGARGAYRQFIKGGIAQGRRPELVGGGLIRSLGGWSAVLSLRRSDSRPLSDERILGSAKFVERVLREAEPGTRQQFASLSRGKELQRIIATKCRQEGISIEELRMGSRRGRISDVRTELAWQMAGELGIPLAEIARRLGVSTSAISKALLRRGPHKLT